MEDESAAEAAFVIMVFMFIRRRPVGPASTAQADSWTRAEVSSCK